MPGLFPFFTAYNLLPVVRLRLVPVVGEGEDLTRDDACMPDPGLDEGVVPLIVASWSWVEKRAEGVQAVNEVAKHGEKRVGGSAMEDLPRSTVEVRLGSENLGERILPGCGVTCRSLERADEDPTVEVRKQTRLLVMGG